MKLSVAALLVGALAIWTMFQFDWAIQRRDRETIADARRILATTRPYHARMRALAAERDRALEVARTAASAAESLDTTVHRLAGDTTIIGLRLRFPPLDSLLVAYDRRDGLRLRQLAALEIARQADARALRFTAPRVVQLEASLGDVVEIADCRLLGIRWLPRCPGRTLSFFVGSGLGFGAGLLLGG